MSAAGAPGRAPHGPDRPRGQSPFTLPPLPEPRRSASGAVVQSSALGQDELHAAHQRDRIVDIHQELARFIARTTRRVSGTLNEALVDGDLGDRLDIRQNAYRAWGRRVSTGLLGPVFAEISLHPRSWLWTRTGSGQPPVPVDAQSIRGRRGEAESRLENAVLMIPVATALTGGDTDTCLAMVWRSVRAVTRIMNAAITAGEQLGADHGMLVAAADEPGLVRLGQRVQLRFLDHDAPGVIDL